MVKVVIKNSLKVIGKYTLVHEDGTEEEIDGKRAFCRCGLSSAMPFCDNTHQSKLKWVKKVEPDTTEDDWENEGGVTLRDWENEPVTTEDEELDNWKERYKGYREHRYDKDNTRVVMGICFEKKNG